MGMAAYGHETPTNRRPCKTHQVGEYMGLSDRQVLRLVHKGQIPARRVGGEYYYDPRRIAKLCGMDE